MIHRYRYMLFLVLAIACLAPQAYGQADAAPQFGVVPTGSYESYHVDAVNMQNGNNIIKIPLFSLPQLGKLSLSFSAVTNGTFWAPTYSCTSDGYSCQYVYGAISPTYGGVQYPIPYPVTGAEIGARIMPDQIPNVIWRNSGPLGCNVANSAGCFTTYWSVHDSTGGSHSLYYDATNISQMRTTDGSGFLYQSGWSQPYNLSGSTNTQTGTPTLITPQGIKVTASNVTDPDNNTIGVDSSLQITDSVNRTIPPIPAATTSTAGCPDLSLKGYQYQPAIGSSAWNVPGPNNTTVTYLVCYARIHYLTNFWGNGGQPIFINSYDGQENHELIYYEAFGSPVVIQSIVLPNKTYWGFAFDAADPNNSSSIAYGTLTALLMPEGGSISYEYTRGGTDFCYSGGFTPLALWKRTVSDNNGHSDQWTYQINWFSNNQSIVTDPAGNDTVYTYTATLSGACAFLEASRNEYQGASSGSAVPLRTTATSYSTTAEPQPAGDLSFPGYGNALATSVTTTMGSAGSYTSTAGGYAGIFSASMPECSEQWNGSSGVCNLLPISSESLTLSIPTTGTTSDYSSALLRSSTKSYVWQTDANYLSANLLDTPYIETISDATGQLSKTTTSYDEASYITNLGVRAAHPTTVKKWNNNGTDISLHTSWTAYGMVDHTTDGLGNTSAQYTYASTTNGGQFAHLYPDSKANALSQKTTYTYDVNTGKVASTTDPNNAVTQFSFDDMGRPTDVKLPATSVGQGEMKACYTDEGGSICSKGNAPYSIVTQITTDAGPVQAQQTFDGLGRVYKKIGLSDPSGADITDISLDYMDRAVSTSNSYRATPQPTDPPDGSTTLEYDALGRVSYRRSRKADSTIISSQHWTYTPTSSGLVTDFYDETQRHWKQTSDALGRLTQVLEPDPQSGTSSLETDYTYSGLGNLLSVAQGSGASQRFRSFVYDSFSQLYLACNPESLSPNTTCPANPTFSSTIGTIYGYDANGNLHTKKDGRGITTTYSYDNLNRIVSRSYTNSDGSATDTPNACYQYDTATAVPPVGNFIGRLTADWTTYSACNSTSLASGFKTRRLIMAYDALGHPLQEQQCTPGNCNTTAPTPYTLSYGYDIGGPLKSFNNGLTNANAISFIGQLDGAGRLTVMNAITRWEDLKHPAIVFSAQSPQSYGPGGNLQQWNLGAGISVTRTYDAQGRVTGETANGYH